MYVTKLVGSLSKGIKKEGKAMLNTIEGRINPGGFQGSSPGSFAGNRANSVITVEDSLDLSFAGYKEMLKNESCPQNIAMCEKEQPFISFRDVLSFFAGSGRFAHDAV